MTRMAETLRIPLRIVFYIEDGEWVAHCLEFDLVGTGDTRKEAIDLLGEAIFLQVQATIEHDNPANLFTPASGEVLRRFAAGKDVATAALELKPIHTDQFEIAYAECREYDGAETACA